LKQSRRIAAVLGLLGPEGEGTTVSWNCKSGSSDGKSSWQHCDVMSWYISRHSPDSFTSAPWCLDTSVIIYLMVHCHIPGGIVIHCIVSNVDNTASHPRRLGTLKCSLLYWFNCDLSKEIEMFYMLMMFV
jgi:hypothetical protein